MENRITYQSFSFHLFVCVVFFFACNTQQKNKQVYAVSYEDFEKFVEATSYQTDAEKYGWSVVQINLYKFIVVENANWRKPDGQHIPKDKSVPVTQVSYNDAIAYCEWANTRLPEYDEYWQLTKNDDRTIVFDNKLPISSVNEVNTIGNVWDITFAGAKDSVRLAGGSLFCAPNSCNGTSKEAVLHVDKETGNTHIGFSVIR